MTARWWLCAILLLMFFVGVASGLFGHGSADARQCAFVCGTIPLYVMSYAWMKSDATARGVAPPPGATALIAVFYAASIPYYLLATRARWRKLGALLV